MALTGKTATGRAYLAPGDPPDLPAVTKAWAEQQDATDASTAGKISDLTTKVNAASGSNAKWRRFAITDQTQAPVYSLGSQRIRTGGWQSDANIESSAQITDSGITVVSNTQGSVFTLAATGWYTARLSLTTPSSSAAALAFQVAGSYVFDRITPANGVAALLESSFPVRAANTTLEVLASAAGWFGFWNNDVSTVAVSGRPVLTITRLGGTL